MGTTQSTFHGIGDVVFTRNVTEPVLVTEVKLRLKGSNLLFKISLSHQTSHLRSGVGCAKIIICDYVHYSIFRHTHIGGPRQRGRCSEFIP